MIPCKHLDHEGDYIACELKTAAPHYPDVHFWLRRVNQPNDGGPPLPTRVQFCKLRGRINDVFSCYGERHCHEPQTVEGEVVR